jgi:hypothetical protein
MSVHDARQHHAIIILHGERQSVSRFTLRMPLHYSDMTFGVFSFGVGWAAARGETQEGHAKMEGEAERFQMRSRGDRGGSVYLTL